MNPTDPNSPRPYGLGVMVSIYEITGDNMVSLVWQTDHTSDALIAEFTARWGQPMGEVTGPFDPAASGHPDGVVMIYEDQP